MYKYLLFSFLFFSSSVFSFEDLGLYGPVYKIKEKNFMDIIEEKTKDVNRTKIKKQFYESAKKFMTVKNNLPTCKETRIRHFVPTFVVPADVILPNGKVIARAGDVINTLDIMRRNHILFKKYMIFIDADNPLQVQLSYLYKNQGNVFIARGNLNKYEKDTRVQSFKVSKSIINKFNIQCVPSIVVQKGNKMKIYEYNPKDLAKKGNN